MQISTKGQYGLWAVFDLALHYGQGCVQNADIATRQHIPEAYLVQLLNLLRKGGVVLSLRGPKGGHVLLKQPDTLTVGEVLRILEGPVDLLGGGKEQTGASTEQGVLRDMWDEVEEAIEGVLSSVTFGDLCQQYQGWGKNLVYHI